jgi:hypothetical protein
MTDFGIVIEDLLRSCDLYFRHIVIFRCYGVGHEFWPRCWTVWSCLHLPHLSIQNTRNLKWVWAVHFRFLKDLLLKYFLNLLNLWCAFISYISLMPIGLLLFYLHASFPNDFLRLVFRSNMLQNILDLIILITLREKAQFRVIFSSVSSPRNPCYPAPHTFTSLTVLPRVILLLGQYPSLVSLRTK